MTRPEHCDKAAANAVSPCISSNSRRARGRWAAMAARTARGSASRVRVKKNMGLSLGTLPQGSPRGFKRVDASEAAPDAVGGLTVNEEGLARWGANWGRDPWGLLEGKSERIAEQRWSTQRDLEVSAEALSRKQARMRRVGHNVSRSIVSAWTISSATPVEKPSWACSAAVRRCCGNQKMDGMAMLLAGVGAQTVQEVDALQADTVIRPHRFKRRSTTQRCFYEMSEFQERTRLTERAAVARRPSAL